MSFWFRRCVLCQQNFNAIRGAIITKTKRENIKNKFNERKCKAIKEALQTKRIKNQNERRRNMGKSRNKHSFEKKKNQINSIEFESLT